MDNLTISSQSPLPGRVQDRVVTMLKELLKDSRVKESELLQQLENVRKEAQECYDILDKLGLVQNSDRDKNDKRLTSIPPIEQPRANPATDSYLPTVNPDNSTLNIGNEEVVRESDLLRGVSQFLLDAIERPADYGFSVFDSESAAYAFIKEKPAAASIDFASLRNRVGQALSRLTFNKKVLKFQEKGRPSKVRYVSINWVSEDGSFREPYAAVTHNLEPVSSVRSAEGVLLDNDGTLSSSTTEGAIAMPQSPANSSITAINHSSQHDEDRS